MMKALAVFAGSNGALTRSYCAQLEARGSLGVLAAHLFRAQKSSTRAKRYGLTCYRGLAYDRKQVALQKICKLLVGQPDLTWGWGQDPKQPYAPWVLYIELPNGQVSFHSPDRLSGPDYLDGWDGQRLNEARIFDFSDACMEEGRPPQFGQIARRRREAEEATRHQREQNELQQRQPGLFDDAAWEHYGTGTTD